MSQLKPKINKIEAFLLSIVIFYFLSTLVLIFLRIYINSTLNLMLLVLMIVSGILYTAYHADRKSQWQKQHPN
jgi:hypothetical protein